MPRRPSSHDMKSARSARVQMQERGGQILEVGDHLDLRVAAASDDEREVLGAHLRLVRRLRKLEAPEQRVAQVQRLDDALEPHSPLGESRNRQAPGHRAEGNDQLVVGQLPRVAHHVHEFESPALLVAGRHPSDQELSVPELVTQRHGHMARVERSAGNRRQQRRVEQEVRTR